MGTFADYNVRHVVRVCPEETYEVEELLARGIECHAFPYADGTSPAKELIQRWPVMVAVALISAGMSYLTAVEKIREVRRGAINKPQLAFLAEYEKKTKKSGCLC